MQPGVVQRCYLRNDGSAGRDEAGGGGDFLHIASGHIWLRVHPINTVLVIRYLGSNWVKTSYELNFVEKNIKE